MKKILAALLLSTGTASAMPMSYQLFDHPDGANNPPDQYGLRIDDLGNGPSDPTGLAFSATFGNVTLFTDSDAGTAYVEGQMRLNIPGTEGGLLAPYNLLDGLFNVRYDMTGLTFDLDGGFTASGGAGSLWDLAGGFQYDFTGKQNGSGDAAIFAFDGHRLPGDDDSPVLRGWLMDAGACGPFRSASADSSTLCVSDASTIGTNDWLVQSGPGVAVSEVPLPAGGLLFGSSLALLGAWRKFAA